MAVCAFTRRAARILAPIAMKPVNIMNHVEGSGIAGTFSKPEKLCSTVGRPLRKLRVPELVKVPVVSRKVPVPPVTMWVWNTEYRPADRKLSSPL